MKKQENSSAFTGMIIGAVVGLMVGFGGLNMVKKSQRDIMLIPALLLGGIGVAAIGYFQGQKIGKEIDVENETGISQFTYAIHQNGRTWIAVTEWSDITGFSYKLITGQADDKELVSLLNDDVIRKYGINSGSKVNVESYHKQERLAVFQNVKTIYNKSKKV